MTALLKVRLFLWRKKWKYFNKMILVIGCFAQGSNLYLVNNELPFGIAKDIDLEGLQAMQIGEWKNHPLWLVAEQKKVMNENMWVCVTCFHCQRMNSILSRGCEINHFLKTHKFCGKCGHKTQQTQDELAVQCIHCGYQNLSCDLPINYCCGSSWSRNSIGKS